MWRWEAEHTLINWGLQEVKWGDCDLPAAVTGVKEYLVQWSGLSGELSIEMTAGRVETKVSWIQVMIRSLDSCLIDCFYSKCFMRQTVSMCVVWTKAVLQTLTERKQNY